MAKIPFFQKNHMGGFERLFRRPWGITRPSKYFWVCGEAFFVIQWPYLLAAFVHDPISHVADCACGCVGDVKITKPSCKLLGMLVIYV